MRKIIKTIYNLVIDIITISDEKFNVILGNDYNSLNLPFSNEKHNFYLCSENNSKFFDENFIPNILMKNKAILYHIPQNGIGSFFSKDINIVPTIHDLIPYVMPETVGHSYLTKFLREMPNIMSQAKGIITVSEHSKRDIMRFFPKFPKELIFPIQDRKSTRLNSSH